MKFDRKTRAHRWLFKFSDAPPLTWWGETNPLWWVADWGHKTLCFFGGHAPERDQCGFPEHDFCLWCHKSMPNSWKMPEVES